MFKGSVGVFSLNRDLGRPFDKVPRRLSFLKTFEWMDLNSLPSLAELSTLTELPDTFQNWVIEKPMSYGPCDM